MKKLLPFILLIFALGACNKSAKDTQTTKIEKIYQNIYSLENEGIQSLSFEISGNHESVKNFLMDLGVDSGKVVVYWKAPFELKTTIVTTAAKPVDLPRWLDFGFAFGIFYGTELVPIFTRPETEIMLLEKEFKLNDTGILEINTGENGNREYTLKDPTQKQKQKIIITDQNNFPLNSSGTRLFERDGQLIEIGYSQNWIKLPNNKAVTSYKQQSVKDKSRKMLEYRITYKKVEEYWLPSEITERKRATERGKIQRQDTRLVFNNYEINSQLPETLFLFKEPGSTKFNFSTPDSTFSSLLTAARAGDIDQIKNCFSKEMMSQFEALTNQASQGITPLANIPGETLKKIQTDVTRWVFASYVEQIEKLNTTLVTQTENRAILTVDYEGQSSLFRGQYHLVKEADAWKIDTNPHIIFKIAE